LRSPSVLQIVRSEDQVGCAKKPPVIVLDSCLSDVGDDSLRSPSVLQTARSEADPAVLAFASSQAAVVEVDVRAEEVGVGDDAQQDETVLSAQGEREHKSVIVLDDSHPDAADDDGLGTASFVETTGSDADVVDLGELDYLYVDHEASGSTLPMTAASSLPFECSKIPPMTVLETCQSDVVDNGLRSHSVLEISRAEAEPTVLAVASTQAGVRADQVDAMCDDDEVGCAKKPPVIVLDSCHSDVVDDGLRSPSVLQTARSEADPTVLAFASSQAAVVELGVKAEQVDAMYDDDDD